MMHAAALAGFSAVLGGAIALVARQRPGVLERTRTFAFAAAAGVVAFHLLPEALPSQGVAALLWMAAGFALPWLLEWLARTVGPGLLRGRGLSGLRVSAEVGFAALVFHSVAEGLALVAALAQPRESLDLEIAIVAHHAPLTAAVVLPFLDLSGARAAGTRAALVAAAGIVGGPLRSGLPGFRDGGPILLSLPLARSLRADSPARPVGLELVAAVRERAPALLTLVVVAAVLEVSARAFPTSFVPAAALLLLVAFCARLDDAGAVVVAAVLVRKGLDPGIAIALLACGPLTRAALVRILGRRGRGAAAAAMVLGCVGAIVAGWL